MSGPAVISWSNPPCTFRSRSYSTRCSWLGEQFGAAYADYMQRVKALIPGVL